MEKLKENYGKLTIKQLEERALKLQHSIVEEKGRFIEILAYIELTRLWRKNPLHSKSSFAVYLADIYNLRIGTYRREKTAFLNFPDEAKKYGVGVVARIQKDCGAVNTKIVLKELDEKVVALKTPIKREQIETIILKHTPPKTEKSTLPKAYWEERAMKAEKELQASRARIKELEAQLERQRPFIESYLAIQASLKDLPKISQHINA